MATSGSTSFNLNIDEIIDEGYERCGLRPMAGYDLKTARRSLNLLFADWGNRGVHLWKVELNEQALTAGTATYTVASNVNDVLEAYISSSGAINGTLNTALTNVATSVVLTDATGFASSGTVQIGLEFITYTGKSTNTLTGATRGASIGHVSPEAAEGGMIGLLQDGDEIHIDVDQYILQANISDEEIAKRKANFVPVKKPLTSRWLGQYRSLVTNASNGAILKSDLD